MEPPSHATSLVILRFDRRGQLAGFTSEAGEVLELDAAALGTPLDGFAEAHLDRALAEVAAAVRHDGAGRETVVVDRRGRRWRAELRVEECGDHDTGLLIALTAAAPPPRPEPATSFVEVMAGADLACAILDAEGAVRWANPALAQLLDTEASTLDGADWFALVVPTERRAGIRRRFEHALAAAGLPWRVEHPLATAGGERRPTAWHGVPLTLPGGRALALIGRDVTAERRDRRALEAAGARAEQASALKSRVLAAVGHDLRQPLQTLRFVHAVLARTVVEPAGREVVGALADSLATMARAVELLVQVSRRAPFDATPHLTPVALGELLAALRARFADAAAAKGLRFTVVATTARVRSDPALLARLLDAFVAAAVRDTESGRVLVGCRRRGDSIVLEVADTRAGAPLAQLAALIGGGSRMAGLEEVEPAPLDAAGLAERFERLADHRLEVRTIVGRGCVFALHLPAAGGIAVAPPRPPATGGDVLVVADDVAERESIVQLLELEGYHVLAGKDEDDAVRQTEGRPPPWLAIVDQPSTPGAGAQALQRRLGGGGEAPVAVVTLTDVAPADGDVAGVRYVEKPADPRALLALIGELTTPEPQPATAADERGAAVAVVGGDAPARERRLALLRDAGHQALGFATTAELLTAGGPARAAAVLLDLGSVGRAGAAELITLTGRAGDLPVVVLHAGDDVGLAVAAMHAGAFDFLAKPVGEDVLVETVRRALREGERRGRRHEAEIEMRHRFDRLTARERDVLRLVVAGGSNKEIAQALGISPRTVENHRARIMEKTGAHSLAELVASARNAGTAE